MQLLDASRLVLASATLALLASLALPRFAPVPTSRLSLLAYAAMLVLIVARRTGWLGSTTLDAIDFDEEPAEVALFACTFAWTLLLIATKAVPFGAYVPHKT
jgi:hypothetical protein